MADESMADEFKAEESMADVVLAALADNMAYVVRIYILKLRNIEILEKKKRV